MGFPNLKEERSDCTVPVKNKWCYPFATIWQTVGLGFSKLPKNSSSS